VTGRYYEQVSLLDPDAPLDPVDPDDPEAWVSIALENNPQVLSAAFGVERAQENVQVQKSGHYPTLDLRAQAAKSNEANIDTRSNNIGLELTIPLYQGGAVNARTREAAYRYEAAKEVLERVQRDVVRRTRDSYVGLETARSRVSALAQAVKSNRSGLEATQAGFDVGTRTIVDVLDSERDLLLAIRDLAVSRYDYILNRLRLLQAAGRISEKQMETISVWLRPPEKPQP
jgi:outer membrane protein